MLSIIRNLLQLIINDIDSNNTNLTYEDLMKALRFILNMVDKNCRMSKMLACDYLGVSRATFDNYVKNGWIPRGEKLDGFKELSWMKSDLDIYLNTLKETK